jgi:hypothetical protein
MKRKGKKLENGKRQQITRAALEREIMDVVKGGTDCKEFVGVIVERVTPADPDASNWTLKGVKYGSADRALCDTALSACVVEKALRFNISD